MKKWSFLRASLVLLAAAAVGSASNHSPDSGRSEPASLTEREKALHALNRLAFGPRPGDLDRVLVIGVSVWIAQQLHPERIADAAASAKLASLPTVSMTTEELFDRFERPLREARQERKREMAAQGNASGEESDLPANEIEKIREKIPPDKRPRRVIEELAAARVLRAVDSDRQLNEVMVDFWMNHFNVYAAKGLDRVFVTSFEREAIRPRIWGRFEDLLAATAKSPAMLFYLDNARSAADESHRPLEPRRNPFRRGSPAMTEDGGPLKKKAPNGLNENYARELMELHTLGVEGGYTQKDVTELARVLTGWSIERQGGGFVFRRFLHDVGSKTVLGHSFPPGGGIEEGEKMIGILANHPSTARHIALELCQRLVSDDPPAELVSRVARRFLQTGGDLRETVRAILESPEFFDPKYYRAKVKSPFEYVVSAIRAADGRTDGRLPVLRAMAQMGEPLYLCQPPTGYSDASAAWVNTGAFVARLNFALAFAANKIPGTQGDLERLVSRQDAADPKKSAAALGRALTGGELSEETRETIQKKLQSASTPADDLAQVPLVAGLILGSPEFQKQ